MAKKPTLQSLQNEIQRLNARIDELTVDPAFGISTRPAVEVEYRKIQKRANFLVFIDIDNLHFANQTHGHEEINNKIKRAVNIRREDVLLRARWYSGDELIFILAGDPSGFCKRLQSAFHKEQMSATMAWIKSSGELHADVYAAKYRVDAAKSTNKRGVILKAVSK